MSNSTMFVQRDKQPSPLYRYDYSGTQPYPSSPDVKMHNILPTVLHTFLMELVRRIRLNIKTS